MTEEQIAEAEKTFEFHWRMRFEMLWLPWSWGKKEGTAQLVQGAREQAMTKHSDDLRAKADNLTRVTCAHGITTEQAIEGSTAFARAMQPHLKAWQDYCNRQRRSNWFVAIWRKVVQWWQR